MKPPPLEYARAASLDEAVQLLASAGDDAKVLAGGQSLVPMLNFRLARPTVLVDVAHIEELRVIDLRDGHLTIGAAVRQHEAARSPLVADSCPLLSRAIAHIGHIQIRARGTVGGSVAHADPASELGATALALDARMHVASVRGRRDIDASDFFAGPYMTELAPDEVLVALSFPPAPGIRTSLREFSHRAGDFALAGVAVAVEVDEGERVRRSRVAGFGVGPAPVAIEPVQELLDGNLLTPDLCEAAGRAAASHVEPFEGPHASPAYRRQLFGVLVEQALREAA
ncbi:MAG TPA: xanthine dehydrogenase family protein subunit M [Thermoleophilaceae bacterium]|nr:xanthine dehydrogenase family protein subunit M [Thermoleophilaceae bacterium]